MIFYMHSVTVKSELNTFIFLKDISGLANCGLCVVWAMLFLKGVVHSPPCHPRCSCLSFFIRKEIKVFDENIPGFFSI